MKKALTYFFAFIALNFTLQWATFAVWLMSAGSSFADVTAMFAGKTTLPLDAPMMITASGVYSITVSGLPLGCPVAQLSQKPSVGRVFLVCCGSLGHNCSFAVAAATAARTARQH